jgi:hypothetical protein
MTLRASVLRAGCASVLALSACDSGETWDQTNLDVITTHQGFVRIDAHAFVTAIAPATADVDVFVDPLGAASYRLIDPGRTGSHAMVPIGTQIVRVVLDGNGAIAKLTMMAKGPPGTNPSLGDWWFAETDPFGTPLDGDDGAPIMGAVAACATCHVDRASDDHLYGVAAMDR